MELILGIGIGIVLGMVGMVGAMRRAESKPKGRTAKLLSLLHRQ